MVKKLARKISKRISDTHKGDYGHVFVIAGSVGLTGAAYLTSMAALRSGSGLVTLGIPESLNSLMEEKLTEIMTKPLPETKEQSLCAKAFSKIKDFSKKTDVVAIGPGLSRNKNTEVLIRKLISGLDKPIVLDADGLNAFQNKRALLKRLNKLSLLRRILGKCPAL